MADTTVAIISVTYHSADVIEQFLDSIEDSAPTRPQVILVDNSPEDGGLAQVVAGYPDVAILRPGRNLGYGAGMNYGASRVDADIEWLVLTNPDLVIGRGAITTLLEAAARMPGAAAFGPLVRSVDGSVYPSARQLPSLRTGIGHAIFVRIWPANPWTSTYRNDLEVIDERAVGWLSGSFLLIRRTAFEAIGGFDERFFMYFEDVDLGRNIGLAGWQNVYVPSAEVVHLGAMSTKTSPKQMIKAHHESAYRYLAKRYHQWYLWPLRAALRIGLGARRRVAKG